MNPITVTADGHAYIYRLDGNAPSDPIEQRGERHYIRMGFAGFNTRANNGYGYTTRAAALATIRKYQSRPAVRTYDVVNGHGRIVKVTVPE